MKSDDQLKRLVTLLMIIDQSFKRKKVITKAWLQNLEFFLNKAGVPLEYDFGLSNYSVYSTDLNKDINSLEELGFLDSKVDSKGFMNKIKIADETSMFLANFVDEFGAPEVIERDSESITRIIEYISSEDEEMVEILAMTMLVKDLMKQQRITDKKGLFAEYVHRLRPSSSPDVIKDDYNRFYNKAKKDKLFAGVK